MHKALDFFLFSVWIDNCLFNKSSKYRMDDLQINNNNNNNNTYNNIPTISIK